MKQLKTKKKRITPKHECAICMDFFPERMSVHEICGIPVFDVDAVECLIDKRGM